MSFARQDLPAGGDVPGSQGLAVRADDLRAVAAEHRSRTGVAFENAQLVPRGHFPDLQRLELVGAGDAGPVGTECYAHDRSDMSAKRSLIGVEECEQVIVFEAAEVGATAVDHVRSTNDSSFLPGTLREVEVFGINEQLGAVVLLLGICLS